MNRRDAIAATDFAVQPVWFRWVNRTWGKLQSITGPVRLDKDSLVQAARRNTGLRDFGPGAWEEPLDRLLESIEGEAALHAAGRFITRQRLLQLLSVRLRAEHWFSKHPEILEQPLYPVRVVSGLQRTGTTKLHRLLAADPDNRALLSWEALNPAPLGERDAFNGRKRIAAARTSERALRLMSPGFFAIHPVEHLAPEEDVLLLDTSFMSTTAEAIMHVPAYAAWLEETDQSPAYAYMVRLLKLLQWQRPAKRWVLKTPHHLEFPDLLMRHLGDVRFVWTHREVCESVPSFLSMVAYSRVMFSNEVRTDQLTDHWLRKTGYMLDRSISFCRGAHQSLFTHVSYLDLVADPMAVLSTIYKDWHLPVSGELEAAFRLQEERNPKGKYGKHHYRPEDFGLDRTDIQDRLQRYLEFLKEKGITV